MKSYKFEARSSKCEIRMTKIQNLKTIRGIDDIA